MHSLATSAWIAALVVAAPALAQRDSPADSTAPFPQDRPPQARPARPGSPQVGSPQIGSPQAGLVPGSAVAADGTVYVEGELLVRRFETADPNVVRAEIRARGARVRRELVRSRIFVVELPVGTRAPDELGAYARLRGVEHVELNGVGMGGGLGGSPDDTHYTEQWHLENTAQNDGTPGADIEALSAWNVETGDASVVLAILDSGILASHPEFAGRALQGYDFVNGDTDPFADHPHGVFVTALAAANTDNGFGVAGVDRECTVLPVKVLNAFNGGTVEWLVDGLDYCVQESATVVSMSLINYPNSVLIEDALQACRDAGCILVACAGNGGLGNADFSWPGASELTISVGATDPDDERASFSGTGQRLDFTAPGHNVYTVTADGLDSFTSFSGCSAATPIAAGIVSLLVAQNPGLTQDEAYALLKAGAEDGIGPQNEDSPGRDDFFGWGRVNAFRSLDPLFETYCSPAIPNSSGAAANLHATGSKKALDNELILTASGLPMNAFGYLLASETQGFIANPGGSDGNLCLGGSIGRYVHAVQNSGPLGSFSTTVDLTSIPTGPPSSVEAGESWSFQVWFRDGSTSNFTDALSIAFQ